MSEWPFRDFLVRSKIDLLPSLRRSHRRTITANVHIGQGRRSRRPIFPRKHQCGIVNCYAASFIIIYCLYMLFALVNCALLWAVIISVTPSWSLRRLMYCNITHYTTVHFVTDFVILHYVSYIFILASGSDGVTQSRTLLVIRNARPTADSVGTRRCRNKDIWTNISWGSLVRDPGGSGGLRRCHPPGRLHELFDLEPRDDPGKDEGVADRVKVLEVPFRVRSEVSVSDLAHDEPVELTPRIVIDLCAQIWPVLFFASLMAVRNCFLAEVKEYLAPWAPVLVYPP